MADKTRLVRGGGRRQDHFGKAFDGVDRAKVLVRDAIANTVQFKLTHEEELDQFGRVWTADWYKALPRWAKGEVTGYCDALRRGQFSPIEKAQQFVHIYEGKLYANFSDWRDKHPDVHPTRMICASVWPVEQDGQRAGKVHHASSTDIGDDEAKALQGQVFPFATQ